MTKVHGHYDFITTFEEMTPIIISSDKNSPLRRDAPGFLLEVFYRRGGGGAADYNNLPSTYYLIN